MRLCSKRKTAETAGADLAGGDWVMRCEARTLDDIRALGGNNTTDEHCFEAVDRVSQANLALYRTFMQPVVRSLVNPSLADAMRKLHPLRLQFELLSDANPVMAPLAGLADAVRENRRPAAGNNPFLAMQEQFSDQIVAAFDTWRVFNETCAEHMFMAAYGSKALQAAAGVDAHSRRCRCERRRKACSTTKLSSNTSPTLGRASHPADCARRSFARSSSPAWAGRRLMSAVSKWCAAFANH